MSWLALGLTVLTTPALAGDKDGDGIPNKTDQCREQAEDADGFQDEDGCPDPDNDADGILDDSDRCPNEPEDPDDFRDDDGCPEPDNDEDGVLDADDRCPHEDENDEQKDGCPAVSLAFLVENGRMKAISELNSAILEAVGKEEEGCEGAASFVRAWLSDNNLARMNEIWEARLARAPEGFDQAAAKVMLDNKGALYTKLKPAIDIYCRDHSGWQGVRETVDAVYAPWLTPAE
jgi:hypothetical protein